MPLNPLQRGPLVEQSSVTISIGRKGIGGEKSQKVEAVGNGDPDYPSWFGVLGDPVVEREALRGLSREID